MPPGPGYNRTTGFAYFLYRALPAGLAALLCLGTISSFLGFWSWHFDLLSQFRPQLSLVGLIVVVVALLARSWGSLLASLVLTVVNLVPLMPYVMGVRASESMNPDPQARLRVLTFNLHGHSTDLAALGRLINRERPDIILLAEAPEGASFSQSVERRYPYRIADDGGIPLDVVFISRWKPHGWSVDRSVAPFRTVVTARLCHPEKVAQCVTFVGLHADQPFGEGAARQKAQLEIAAKHVRAAPDNAVLVMGDLNMTPWSRTFRAFTEQTKLYDTARARKLSGTWNSRSLITGLPIDHILIGPDLTVVDSRLDDNLGSDHFPLIADLAFTR